MTTLEPGTRRRRVQYPESDGTPVGETDLHINLLFELTFALKWFLSNVRAYVAGNLFLYYEEGNKKAVVSPDVFVVLGAEQRSRRTYRVWNEGGLVPNVVIELTSKKTKDVDATTKVALYERLGVQEYFLFDPYGDYLKPRLQGYRLMGKRYAPMQEFPLHSTVLGLDLRTEDDTLRLYVNKTGERLPTSGEEVLARRAAEAARERAEQLLIAESFARLAAEARAAEQSARAADEAQARQAAEQRMRELEAELRRLRGEE